MHFGMVIVGLPYSFQGQMTLDEIVGGSPYGVHRQLPAVRAATAERN